MRWEDELQDYIERIRTIATTRLQLEQVTGSGLVGDLAVHFGLEKLDQLDPNFSRFADGHPAACEHMVEKLADVHGTLMSNTHDLNDVLDVIAGWRDVVAEAFRTYVGMCGTAVAWRLDYVGAMAMIASYQRDIIAATRDDVRRVADAMLSALAEPFDGGGGFGLGDALTIAGAIAVVGLAVASPLPEDGAAVVVALELVSRVTNSLNAVEDVASALSPGSSGSSRTVDILQDGFTALTAIEDGVAGHEAAVVDALTALYDGFTEYEQVINPVRPPVDLTLLDPAYMRTIDLNGIRQAGGVDLPTMAALNARAALQVASIEENEPHAFEGDLHDSPLPRWRARRDELRRVFADTAATLAETGVTLGAIAATWEDGEAANGELFAHIGRLLEGS